MAGLVRIWQYWKLKFPHSLFLFFPYSAVLYASKIPDKQRKHANTSNASSRKYRNRRVSEILYLYLVLSHVQTQGVIEAGILPALATLLLNTKKCIKKEACWVVSNIAAGTRAQVAAIIQNEIIPPLVSCLAPRNDTEVRKEACWAICNCVSGGGPEQTSFVFSFTPFYLSRYLVSQNILEQMCELLTSSDNKMVIVILEVIMLFDKHLFVLDFRIYSKSW